MNERIKLLAEQAGYTPLPGFDFANSLEEVFIKKFAELIVRECADICAKQVAGAVGTYAGVHNNAIGACVKGIKEHFGVE